MKEITLYGAGGHCYAVIELIRSLGDYEPVSIRDDATAAAMLLGIPIIGSEAKRIQNNLCITIGDNATRKKIALENHANYPVFVHGSVVSYPSVAIGDGSVVLPNAVLDAAVVIGKHCIINNNATISHNVRIGDYSHIAIQAAIAGGVIIGEGVLVGAGSVILPEIEIGPWSVIGAGAVVTKDVPANSMVVGNPARLVGTNQPANES